MSLIPIAVKIVSGALGTFMTGFTILNLCSDIGNPFGSFGVKFIYEMDQIMGGLLGKLLANSPPLPDIFPPLRFIAGRNKHTFTDYWLLPY